MIEEKKERIVSRILTYSGNYGFITKNYIDEAIDHVLEKKPEEKIWKVVRKNVCPVMDVPCYRLNKKDLIKVGRVRFKIGDIMPRVYH